MYIMLLKIELPSNNNEYIYTLNIPIYISYHFKSLQIPFYTSLLNFLVNIDYTRFIYVLLYIMLFFVCYVGYEYAMCNFTPNKLCYVMFTS